MEYFGKLYGISQVGIRRRFFRFSKLWVNFLQTFFGFKGIYTMAIFLVAHKIEKIKQGTDWSLFGTLTFHQPVPKGPVKVHDGFSRPSGYFCMKISHLG